MMQTLGVGFSFTEAPRWHDGALWFSDFYTHRVIRWSDNTFETVCTVEGQPSGLGFTPEGELLVVSMIDRRLLRLRNGVLETAADLSEHCPGIANDMLVDARGRAYIGNDGPREPFGPTVLLRVDPDETPRVVADGLVTPNGMALTPDRTRLVVAESFAGRLTAFDVAEDGSLENRSVWADFGAPTPPSSIAQARRQIMMIPDGIAFDTAGRLWVADAGGTGVWCLEEGGRIVDHVDTNPYTAYSVTLGGDDGRTLFIAAGPDLDDIRRGASPQAAILSVRVDTPGLID